MLNFGLSVTVGQLVALAIRQAEEVEWMVQICLSVADGAHVPSGERMRCVLSFGVLVAISRTCHPNKRSEVDGTEWPVGYS